MIIRGPHRPGSIEFGDTYSLFKSIEEIKRDEKLVIILKYVFSSTRKRGEILRRNSGGSPKSMKLHSH